jgi:small GTP-binding protein
MPNQKEIIRNYIAVAEIEKALENLRDYIQDNEMSDEIIIISGQYAHLLNSYRKDIIPFEDYLRQSNRIALVILEILNRIEDLEEATSKNKEIPLYEAKLIFIGSGNVGKTSLVNTIIDGKYNPNEIKTEGISIRDWKVKAVNDIYVHIWDFGGQEIMHATHKFFMTQNSVYVIVVTPREEDRYGETELSYWLKLVQSFAPDSPIIVAINKCEVHTHNIDKRTHLINYPNIQSFRETSCVNNVGISQLKGEIETAITKLPHLGKPIPQSYLAIKNRLSKIKEDFISYNDYVRICREVEPGFKEDSMSALVSLLHNLGIILNFREELELEQTQVLNPEWVTQGVYKIINSPILAQQKGVISIDRLADVLDKKKFPRSQHLFIVGLMEKFELCYFLPDNRRTIFIPNAFGSERPQNLVWEEKGTLQFQYNYDILPSSIISRLIVKLHPFIIDGKYWRDGAIIKKEDLMAFIFTDRTNLTLNVSIKGENRKKELLGNIRFHLDDIHASFKALKISQKIPYEGVLIDYEELIICQEEGVDITKSKNINMAAIEKKKILFFASNPTDTGRLRLGAEVRDISEGLLRSKLRDNFDLLQRFATRPMDLRRSILNDLPNIVHFSGHGTEDKAFFNNFDIQEYGVEGGIILEDDNGNYKMVNAKALGQLFSLFSDSIECVVLNACYSEAQANEIAKHIKYVIGMSYSITDKAAITFSTAFYDAIGAGSNIEFAFSYAKNAIQLDGLSESETPKLLRG